MMANVAASTLAKLKNKARQQGIQLQQLLNLFCQEEFLRRVSRSKYKDHLILKGGFLLYTISEFATRPTVDADYLLKGYPNDLNAVETLINDIVNFPGEYDYIQFEVKNTKVISEVKEYHGIKLLPDTLGNLVDKMPALKAGEALLIGESIILPSIVQIDKCETPPSSNDIPYWEIWKEKWKHMDIDKIRKEWYK